jgi:hypothetical protein
MISASHALLYRLNLSSGASTQLHTAAAAAAAAARLHAETQSGTYSLQRPALVSHAHTTHRVVPVRVRARDE